MIHKLNAIRPENLVVINSGAISKEIVDHYLFGYVTGAVTVADADMPRAFQDASSSLLLLDEVGELAVELHRKFSAWSRKTKTAGRRRSAERRTDSNASRHEYELHFTK